MKYYHNPVLPGIALKPTTPIPLAPTPGSNSTIRKANHSTCMLLMLRSIAAPTHPSTTFPLARPSPRMAISCCFLADIRVCSSREQICAWLSTRSLLIRSAFPRSASISPTLASLMAHPPGKLPVRQPSTQAIHLLNQLRPLPPPALALARVQARAAMVQAIEEITILHRLRLSSMANNHPGTSYNFLPLLPPQHRLSPSRNIHLHPLPHPICLDASCSPSWS